TCHFSGFTVCCWYERKISYSYVLFLLMTRRVGRHKVVRPNGSAYFSFLIQKNNMTAYVPPLRDLQFVMETVLDLPADWARMPAFADLDAATARQVVEEAGRFAAEVLAPINGPADLQGCTYANGEVTTPDGFREAYRAFVEGGWASLACAPDV